MRLFLDANVLFTAAHNPRGKAALALEAGQIAELGTLTANEMQVPDQAPTFTIHPKLTPLQERSFELLGASHRM